MNDDPSEVSPEPGDGLLLPGERMEPTRRAFLSASGFGISSALFASCSRAPLELALPRLVAEPDLVPGSTYGIATTCGACSASCGVLARCRDGRPIKLEGNPDHPLSRGGPVRRRPGFGALALRRPEARPAADRRGTVELARRRHANARGTAAGALRRRPRPHPHAHGDEPQHPRDDRALLRGLRRCPARRIRPVVVLGERWMRTSRLAANDSFRGSASSARTSSCRSTPTSSARVIRRSSTPPREPRAKTSAPTRLGSRGTCSSKRVCRSRVAAPMSGICSHRMSVPPRSRASSTRSRRVWGVRRRWTARSNGRRCAQRSNALRQSLSRRRAVPSCSSVRTCCRSRSWRARRTSSSARTGRRSTSFALRCTARRRRRARGVAS
jgi:hypothetical protein